MATETVPPPDGTTAVGATAVDATAVGTMPAAPVARGAVRPAYLVAGVLLLAAAVTAAVTQETGVSSVLLFLLLPDVALLVGIGAGPHQPGQLPRRAVPAYNLLHSPAVPVAMLLVAATGLLGTYWVV